MASQFLNAVSTARKYACSLYSGCFFTAARALANRPRRANPTAFSAKTSVKALVNSWQSAEKRNRSALRSALVTSSPALCKWHEGTPRTCTLLLAGRSHATRNLGRAVGGRKILGRRQQSVPRFISICDPTPCHAEGDWGRTDRDLCYRNCYRTLRDGRGKKRMENASARGKRPQIRRFRDRRGWVVTVLSEFGDRCSSH
jgi:hypothetical protein